MQGAVRQIAVYRSGNIHCRQVEIVSAAGGEGKLLVRLIFHRQRAVDLVKRIPLKARWKDIEKPTGEIVIGTNKWQKFLNKITFGLFFKDTQEVTINATDNSGTVFVSYLVTDQDLSEEELKSLVFSGYEEPFRIDRNGEYIVYAMLVDTNLNITYLRSDRVTVDNVQPVIGGIENGKTYCEAQTVTIDEKYLDTVTVNGTEVTLDENGSFILSAADGEQKMLLPTRPATPPK